MSYLRIFGSRNRQESPAQALLNLFSLRILWQQRWTEIRKFGNSLAAEKNKIM